VTPAPSRRLDDLGHLELATLAREWFLAGHLTDRAGMPHLLADLGRDAMVAVAIDEWMGASPIYTARMQRALGFGGEDVATMFKGMQLDIGAPPEFLDFRFSVHDDGHGEFHLDHCGALMDAEPMGAELVHAMCHTIEDPTFEATVCASNPRARMEPVHRPPRQPADRHPHCHWRVRIDHDAPAHTFPAVAERLSGTAAATVGVAAVAGVSGTDGRATYEGPVDPDLRMEDFSSQALSLVAQEAALQAHLLTLSFLAASKDHAYPDPRALAVRQFTGVAGVVAGRVARAFDTGHDAAGLATVLELHPAFHPRSYIDWRISVCTDGTVLAGVWPSPATAETLAPGWGVLLAGGECRPLAAIAGELDPCWTVAVVDPDADPATAGALAAWKFTHGDVPQPVDDEVTLTAFSTGAAFTFRRVGVRPEAGRNIT
jgi:hypothetical protein